MNPKIFFITLAVDDLDRSLAFYRDGLGLEHSMSFDLDYRLHYETGLLLADFNGDGRLDVGALGNTKTGVGAGGPLAVYVYLQTVK